jgi:hypothetical protein
MEGLKLKKLEGIYVDANDDITTLTHKYVQILKKVIDMSQDKVNLNSDDRLLLSNLLYTIFLNENDVKLSNDNSELLLRVTSLLENGILNGLANGDPDSDEIIRETNDQYRQLLKYVKNTVESEKIQKRYNRGLFQLRVVRAAYAIIIVGVIILIIVLNVSTSILLAVMLGIFVLSAGFLIGTEVWFDSKYDLDLKKKIELTNEMKKSVSWVM